MMTDFALGTTFDFKFTTRAFATGIPTVLAGTPVVEIYEDNSLTQITGAETLTVDFDAVVGLNNLRIVATSGNGFGVGQSYSAIISTGTVGGVSVVGEVILNFTIEHQSALRPTTAGRTLDVTATGAAGIDWANVENPTTALDLSGTDIQLVDTATANTDMRGTDSAALASVVGALADAAAAGDPTSADTLMQYAKQLINTLEGTIGIPAYPAAADPANDVSLAEAIRAIRDDVTGIAGAAMRGTDSAALASVVGALADSAAAGDPTAVDTIMQYVKQLINVLVGTAGIGTFPTEQAPANGINLAEVMRAIFNDTDVNLDALVSSRSSHGDPDPSGFIDVSVASRLAPTVASRTLDVTAAGEAGLDLDNTVGTLSASEIPNLDAAITTRSSHAAADVARLVNPQTNIAFSDIPFEMYDSVNHNPNAGLTVTGERSIDGGAYAAVSGAIAEVGNGTYQFDALAADMNGALITFRFSSAGADDTFVHVKTAS